MDGVEYLVIAFFFGLATGIIARGKGSSFWIWFVIGAVVPLIGLIAVILYRVEKNEPERAVPELPQGPEALRPGLPALRHRPVPAGPGGGRTRRAPGLSGRARCVRLDPAAKPSRTPLDLVEARESSACVRRVRIAQSLPQPGPDDRVGEADAVAEDRRLLRVAVEALFDRDRDLLGGDAALDRLDHELGGVELLLAQDQLREDGGADGAVAVGAVGDVGAGDGETRRLKKTMPSSRAKWLRSAWPSTREPWATSTSPSSTGLTRRSISRRQVLAVGVEGDDDLGARIRPSAGSRCAAQRRRRGW